MLTLRSISLVATSLLTGYVAAAQSAPAGALVGSSGVPFGLVLGLLGLVGLAILLTGLMVAAQLKRRGQQPAAAAIVPASATEGRVTTW